jgi:hypothetical protein
MERVTEYTLRGRSAPIAWLIRRTKRALEQGEPGFAIDSKIALSLIRAIDAERLAIQAEMRAVEIARERGISESFALGLWREDALAGRPPSVRLAQAAALELDELLGRKAA